MQALCERAKAAMSGDPPVGPVMETGCISMLVANGTQLGQVDFEGCALLLLSMKDVSVLAFTNPM